MNNTPKIAGTFVIGVILLIGAYIVFTGNMSSEESTSNVSIENSSTSSIETSPLEPEVEPATTQNESQIQANINVYSNGQYTSSTEYRVPEGHTESITITATIQDDTVSNIEVNTVATNRESEEYQDRFDPLIVGEVEGKSLDDADVSRLGGASLTSDAFNDLLDAIRADAQS